MTRSGPAFADLLPAGGTLSGRQWASRHDLLSVLLLAHLPALLLLGLARGSDPGHLAVELAGPALALAVARVRRLPQLARALATSMGLVVCSAVLVHLTDGSIEAHFHFFVVVSTVAFYEQWPVLGLTVAFVLVHHLALGAVDPRLVFAHPGEGEDWALWSFVHALAIAAQCVVALAHWRTHERAFAAEREAARVVLQREAALQEAVRQAHVAALAADVAHGMNTPVQYASDNVRFLGSAVTAFVGLASSTRDALDALPAELCAEPLAEVRERHRALGRDWDGDDVLQALGDCLAGLEEVSRLVLELQDLAGRPPAVPAPRSPGHDDGAAPSRGRRRREAAA